VHHILAYHERTKHHLKRYARSPGHLDWDTQPDPFRTFSGAARLEPPLLADALTATSPDLYVPGAVPPRRLELNTLAIFFELSLGLSAWKEYRGSRWALRCNPSSGNLHPTEGYAIVPESAQLPPGVYHYVSRDHCLERRCAPSTEFAALLPQGHFLFGLSSVPWREAWKYGERAYRYCQHDAGHALAAARYSAAALGWSAVLLDELSDEQVAGLLGLDRDEDFATVSRHDREHPDLILLVSTTSPRPTLEMPRLVDAVRRGAWSGRANPLSPAHVNWSIIEDAAAAASKPVTPPAPPLALPSLPLLPRGRTVPAAALIRQRRSCLALDGHTSIPAATFYAILDHLLPRPSVPPWDALPWLPHLHAGIFVHRVDGLPSGLYLLERSDAVHDRLRAELRSGFVWTRPAGCPEHVRLFLLTLGDFRQHARTVSCHQEIASDGAFSLGMIADFGESIRQQGAWWYRRLFWESGVLGHVLYLEAEAAGVRGTGIGCYFDDAFHQLLGLKGDRFQSLYHFTLGGPVEDPRLQTIAPYAHLRR
jgi:SagB-type dehydrogenase family enzyme